MAPMPYVAAPAEASDPANRLGKKVASLAVFYLDHPQVTVGLEAFTNQGVYPRLVLYRQALELGWPIGRKGRRVKPRLPPGAGHLHQNIPPILVAPMDDRGERPARAGAAQQGRNPDVSGNLSRHGGVFTTISPGGARFAPLSGEPRKPFGRLPMLATLASSVFDAVATAPTAEDQRIGVYVLAGIFGLLVSGIVSCIKEMRNETATRP